MVPPDDQEALANALQRLLEDASYRERLGDEALRASRATSFGTIPGISTPRSFMVWRHEVHPSVNLMVLRSLCRRVLLLAILAGCSLGQGMGYLLRAVYFVLIARLLGVLQYGVVVGAIALVNMVTNYGRLGSSVVFLRHVSADRTQFAVYWGNILLVTLSMSTLLIVALHFAAGHLIAPASAAVIVPTAIASCLCEQLTIGAGQVFQTFEKMGITATLNLLTSLARTLTAMGMLLVLHHATAGQWVIASMVVSALAAIAAVAMVTIEFGWPQIEPRLFLKRGAEGAEYALSASTGCAYNDLDKAMLSHFGMSAANGIYSMAYRAIDLATMPASSMEAAAEPRMFQLGATSLQQTATLGAASSIDPCS